MVRLHTLSHQLARREGGLEALEVEAETLWKLEAGGVGERGHGAVESCWRRQRQQQQLRELLKNQNKPYTLSTLVGICLSIHLSIINVFSSGRALDAAHHPSGARSVGSCVLFPLAWHQRLLGDSGRCAAPG